MTSSRIAVFHGPGQPFTHETVAVPALREGELLVRNEYTTLCRSDLNTFAGKRTEKTPTILGHEIVGRIEELGPGAPATDGRGAPLRAGDRITWAIFASDPCSCLAQRGIPQKGADLFKYGHERITPDSNLHGGLAEHCLLRRHTPVIRLDESVPLPVAALINCSVATVAGSLRVAGTVTDRTVLIAGAGMLGVVACAMCRLAGAKLVIAADIDEGHLTGARGFGVDAIVRVGPGRPPLRDLVAPLAPGGAVDVALDYSGVPETMEALLATLGIGGTLVLIGATFPQRALQIDAERLVRQVHTVRGLHNYNAQDFATAVEFIERHHAQFPFAALVDDRFDLDSVDAAFADGVSSGAHRVGLRPVCRRTA
jgi:putative phosphonate catabolism associated alcohol dehydrogenase